MNRDAMLVALGVGVGALISTEQGRHIIGSLAKTPVAQALGEGTVNLFKNMSKEDNNAAEPERHGQHAPQPPQMEAGQPDGTEQGV